MGRAGNDHDRTRARWAAAATAIAPVVMLTALAVHPYLARLPDAVGVAAAVRAGTSRWVVTHLLAAIGSGLVAMAFLAIRRLLADAGDDRSSAWGLPLVVFGSVLYAFLPGLEFAPLAAHAAGGDVLATQEAIQPVLVPMLAASTLTFATGVLGFVRGLFGTRVLGSRTTLVVGTALVVLALARVVPLGAAQFHVQAVAGIVGLWPLAVVMWRQESAEAANRTAVPAS